jgi:hypothetical protein
MLYRKKAGRKHQGYDGNFSEICSDSGNIIESYGYENNLHIDIAFGKRL